MPFGIILSLIAANYITPYVIRGGGHVIDDIFDNMQDELYELLMEHPDNEIAFNIDSNYQIYNIVVGQNSEVACDYSQPAVAYVHSHVRPHTTCLPSGNDMSAFMYSHKLEIILTKEYICFYNPTPEFMNLSHDNDLKQCLLTYYQALKMLCDSNIISFEDYKDHFECPDWSSLHDLINECLDTEPPEFRDYLLQPGSEEYNIIDLINIKKNGYLRGQQLFNIEIRNWNIE